MSGCALCFSSLMFFDLLLRRRRIDNFSGYRCSSWVLDEAGDDLFILQLHVKSR